MQIKQPTPGRDFAKSPQHNCRQFSKRNVGTSTPTITTQQNRWRWHTLRCSTLSNWEKIKLRTRMMFPSFACRHLLWWFQSDVGSVARKGQLWVVIHCSVIWHFDWFIYPWTSQLRRLNQTVRGRFSPSCFHLNTFDNLTENVNVVSLTLTPWH